MATTDDLPVIIPCNANNTTTQNVNNISFTSKKSLKIMYLNAQSLNNKIEDVERLINQLNDQPHVIAVTETWFTNSISKKQIISNYNKISAFRPNRPGGGASIYVNKAMTYRETYVWSNDDDSIVKIELFDEKKICDIMCIYRSPCPVTQSFSDFINKLDEVLSNCGSNTIIIGDMNVDLRKDDSNTKSYLETLHSNGFTVGNCKEITRPISSSNIDHIITNNYNTLMNIMHLHHYISDHTVIFVEMDHLTIKLNKSLTKTKTTIDYDKLKHNLERNNNNIFNNNNSNADQNYELFINNLTTQLNQATKQKIIKINGRHLKPWTDAELQSTMDATAFWFKKFSRDRENKSLEEEYKRWAAKLKQMKNDKWTSYNSNKIHQNLSDSRKLWKIIKTNILEEEPQAERILIQQSGSITSEKTTITENFNEYFTTIADKISSKLPNIPRQQLEPPLQPAEQKILYSTTEDEVKSTIKELKNTTSVGQDNISTKILKECINIISPPLTELINQSLNEGLFPNQLKIAKIIPIFKAGDRTLIENYRPIALLSVISKIYEKIVRTRLLKYLDEKNIINMHQYGFRKKSNTETALFDLINRIQCLIQKKRKTGIVFYDLRKAFDTVNIEILLTILQNIGLNGSDLAWFRSYLCGRSQFVRVGEVNSSSRLVTSSVPQGSVLGPILFLLYVNQVQHLELEGDAQLYADDIAVIYEGVSYEDVKNKIQHDFTKIFEWTASMKLSINFEKTNIMLMKQDLEIDQPLIFNNCKINFVKKFKYLGIDLDCRLNFIPYLDKLRSKLSKIAGLFKKMRNVTPYRIKKQLFDAFFNSHVLYGLNIWGLTFNYLVEGIQTIQNKAIKNLFGYNPLENTKKIHKETKTLSVSLSHLHKSCCLIHNIQANNIHTNTKTKKNNNGLRNNDEIRNDTNNFTRLRTKPLLYTYINYYNKLDRNLKNENKKKFQTNLKIKLKNECFNQGKMHVSEIFT
jgi:Reverse transcriptase (RNA-dependent DNA polymerase)